MPSTTTLADVDTSAEEKAPTPAKRRRGLFWFSLIVNFILMGGLVAYAYTPDLNGRVLAFVHASPEYHRDYQACVRAQVVAQRGITDQTVVFLGDSIVASADLDQVVSRPYLNLGIGGDTLVGLLYRVPRYDQLVKASAIVIHIGVNDLAHFDDTSIINNYRLLLETLPPNMPVLVHAILPINEDLFRSANSSVVTGQKTSNDRIVKINMAIQEIAQNRPNTMFCSSCALVSDEKGNLQKEFTADGVHLNDRGKQIMAETLRTGLGSLVKLRA